jgi:hypothetical protein
MAHTEPRHGDKRQHYRIPIRVKVYMKFNGGEASGIVTSHDNGDWIYVGWSPVNGKRPNSYLRSSQVYRKDI